MTPPSWLVLLTDTDDEPCLVNLAQVAYVVVHATGSTCITFTSREAMLVQQTPQEIAQLCAGVPVPYRDTGSLYAGEGAL